MIFFQFFSSEIFNIKLILTKYSSENNNFKIFAKSLNPIVQFYVITFKFWRNILQGPLKCLCLQMLSQKVFFFYFSICLKLSMLTNQQRQNNDLKIASTSRLEGKRLCLVWLNLQFLGVQSLVFSLHDVACESLRLAFSESTQ